MNIVNLIEKLQEVLSVHGNLKVYSDIPPEENPNEGFEISLVLPEELEDTQEIVVFLS